MATMNEKDYYEILGVSKDATSRDIQKAFQQKARKLHPDAMLFARMTMYTMCIAVSPEAIKSL